MRLLLLFPVFFALAGAAQAADPATACETAIASAEYSAHLPPRLLAAIAVVETGRFDEAAGRVRPWPWTINAEGAGHFYPTRALAIDAAKAMRARGVRSIDVGCLQVNLMYHPDAFASLEDAFDPSANAIYAAGFLNRLHTEGEDWAHAIGAYHSETPALGEAYRVMVMLRWKNPSLAFAVEAPTAYRAFKPAQSVYGAFAPRSRAYGAFAGAGR